MNTFKLLNIILETAQNFGSYVFPPEKPLIDPTNFVVDPNTLGRSAVVIGSVAVLVGLGVFFGLIP